MPGETYRSAGVDLEALGKIKESAAAFSQATHVPQVMGSTNGFAGAYRLEGYEEPVLVSSTDGVGTKLKIGSLMGQYESLGIDLVNLNVNDILTKGAKPLFFLDYVSMGTAEVQRTDALLRGMARACCEAGCVLIGGETAQTTGVYQEDAYDLAGFVVGAVERRCLIDGSSINEGDVLLGLPSSGVHTNGFSLVRKVLRLEEDPAVLYQHHAELGRTLGEELLIPHRCYYPTLEPVLDRIKGIAHISGAGLVGNMPRVLPPGVTARFQSGSWQVHPIFRLIQRVGSVEEEEMFRVFNMGLGMVLVCDPDHAKELQQELPEAGVVGDVVLQSEGGRVVIQA